MRIELVELHGSEEIGRRISLDYFPIQLGRGVQESAGVVALPDCGGIYLSKLHCTIFKKGTALFLADGDPEGRPSHNGIWLDDKPIKKPVLLHPGQIFILLNPPPCEIQIRVLEGAETAEDTLTPAVRGFVEQPDAEALERLSLAVAYLRKGAKENQALDAEVRADVARLRAEKGSLLHQLEEARKDFSSFRSEMAVWKSRQDRSRRWLIRLMSGTMLSVALIGGVVMANNQERQDQLIDISLKILLGLVGTGGLVMSQKQGTHERHSNSGDALPQKIP